MNRLPVTMALACWACLCIEAPAAPPPSGLRIAAVRDGRVCTRVDDTAMRCWGEASTKARLPTWSRDGMRIAYVDDADPAAALAWLVVIDLHGRPLSRLPIKPVGAGEVRSGMRFVESLEWIGADRVVASGSINPSSTESLVFDLSRAAVVAEHVDDAGGASFSPDGRHVLLVEGAPHVTAPGARAPALRLDGRLVLRDIHADLAGIGPVHWSADGTRFALTARDAGGRHRIVVGHASGRTARWVDLPPAGPGADTAPALFWSGQDLHAQRMGAAETGAATAGTPGTGPLEEPVMSVDQRGAGWRRVAEPSLDPFPAAARLRSSALQQWRPADAVDADVWCAACALEPVARRRGVGAD